MAGSQLAGPFILAGAPLAVAVVIGCYLVGFAFQLMALGRINAASAGIVYCIEPVIAALAATVILGESFGAAVAWRRTRPHRDLRQPLTRGERAAGASR